MKINQIIIAGTLLVSVASFAQKDELKALKKIYDKDEPTKDDVIKYKQLLTTLEPIVSTDGDKIAFKYYNAVYPMLEMVNIDQKLSPIVTQAKMASIFSSKNLRNITKTFSETLDFETKTGKKVFTDEIKESINEFKPMIFNMAIALGDKKKYNESSELLYAVYQLDKKDQDKLYYAANYAINGQDFTNALALLKELKTLNYTGEKTLYYAKNVASGNEDLYESKTERDNLVKLKTHILPRDAKEPSKKSEIIKNIALILVQEGKNDEAKDAIAEARKANPDDSSLLLTEADLYYKLNDIVTYKKLINEALEKNPNDANLVYNLGIVSNSANQLEDATKYYKRAIELDPNFINAYLNLADNLLKPDAEIVEQMNKLGTSAADIKKYDVLKAQRQKMFNDAMPILEKAHQLDDKNDVVKSNLMSVYKYLELNDTEKYKALKAKM